MVMLGVWWFDGLPWMIFEIWEARDGGTQRKQNRNRNGPRPKVTQNTIYDGFWTGTRCLSTRYGNMVIYNIQPDATIRRRAATDTLHIDAILCCNPLRVHITGGGAYEAAVRLVWGRGHGVASLRADPGKRFVSLQ